MAKQRYVRFWSRRSIVSLIGIDYPILEKSEHDNLPKFYLAGFLVLGILAISFCSVFYAFDLMFDMWHAEILLSSFFSLMFFTIYIFLIQTFSKEVFPAKYRLKFFNLSNLTRLGFVLMIGFLLAQPIKIFMVRHQLDNDLEGYKEQLYLKFCNVNKNLYSTDLNKLFNDKSKYQAMPQSETLDDEIAKIDINIDVINNQIDLANNKAKASILSSNFFIKRIELASKYSKTTVIVILVLILFLTPIFLIYSISGTSRYYALKKENDKKLVVNEYLNFKAKYTSLFERKYQLSNVHFHEPFLDPPFNTTRNPLPDYLSQEDFFKNLIG
ncbi:DUF4407 domain-containing protein [Pedobacter polaris]|uniref:DUF4407 domain-containing protein n=1 Tax=Pedobacter polaris TaxID=2571273 RepID=A0A4U1CVA7_9SPHI|nr:DUF4407 domain-containing protein [Pedobacter polaris]TKC12763.1 DUF4407 domain-containing protein [Pedobacter polaris]